MFGMLCTVYDRVVLSRVSGMRLKNRRVPVTVLLTNAAQSTANSPLATYCIRKNILPIEPWTPYHSGSHSTSQSTVSTNVALSSELTHFLVLFTASSFFLTSEAAETNYSNPVHGTSPPPTVSSHNCITLAVDPRAVRAHVVDDFPAPQVPQRRSNGQ